MAKKRVMLGFLGTVLDSARGSGRWQRWRPNIAVHQLAQIDRVELFAGEQYRDLAERVRDDVALLSPDT